MSSLAQVLLSQGNVVRGSDRSRDRNQNLRVYDQLEDQGVAFYPQDGTGIDHEVDTLVVSSAVEETIPDVRAALSQGIHIRKRAEVLAELFNQRTGIAIGGTSGKSTVTGMIGHILQQTGGDPTVINGGIMLNAAVPPLLGNAICGGSDLVVIEADESDGTIVLYDPSVAVLTNISVDHKPMEELLGLFEPFCARARNSAVVNLDCEATSTILSSMTKSVTFSVENSNADVSAQGIKLTPGGVKFQANGVLVRLQVPGRHNVSNAVAAICTCQAAGVPLNESAEALSGFKGIERRLQVIGQTGGVTVIDDFAHNPDKIAATLATLKAVAGRLLVMFQPHGFGPTRFLKDGLIAEFAGGLGQEDLLAMPEIYFAGGTAQKDISSRDLVNEISSLGRNAIFMQEREGIARRFVKEAREGDRVVIMGARDDTLTSFAEGILAGIRDR